MECRPIIQCFLASDHDIPGCGWGEPPSTLAVHPIAPRDLRRGGWIQREIARHYVTGEACSTGARLMRETREPAKASSMSSRINSSIVEGVDGISTKPKHTRKQKRRAAAARMTSRCASRSLLMTLTGRLRWRLLVRHRGAQSGKRRPTRTFGQMWEIPQSKGGALS